MKLVKPEPEPDEPSPLDMLRDMAMSYGMDALLTLDKISRSDDYPAAARVAAANSLLDRGFGKVPQPVEGGGPGVTVVNVVTGVRGRD